MRTLTFRPVESNRNPGGASGDRTPDLITASDALSQLSYRPRKRAHLLAPDVRSSKRPAFLTFSSDEAKAEEMRAALLSLVLLSACHGYDDLALLEVEQIGPPEIEPGTTLRIRGHGFPLGRDPSIRLRGRSYRPGAAPTSIEASLPGIVRSESLIEVPVTAELIDAMGSRVTIDGEIRVAFPASDGQREVFSAERVRLDLLPDTEMQLRMEGTADVA